MQTELEELVSLHRELGIDRQIDYDKFYLHSLITHSTVIEGSAITELGSQIMFDQGISLKGKGIVEQHMNLDLGDVYEYVIRLTDAHTDITADLPEGLSALVLKNTGQEYKTILGDLSSARGDSRLLNVTAGPDRKSYMNYSEVPARSSEFYARLNREHGNYTAKSMTQLYETSFDIRYSLVTIHPWADGSSRMARLLMSMLQFEFGLISTKILKEDKEEYIKALVEARENKNLNVFREFMTAAMIKNLTRDVEVYHKSIDDTPISGEKPRKSREKKVKSGEKIMALLSQDNMLSAATLAERMGITAKATEKQIAALEADKVLRRIGPDEDGYWWVVEKRDWFFRGSTVYRLPFSLCSKKTPSCRKSEQHTDR